MSGSRLKNSHDFERHITELEFHAGGWILCEKDPVGSFLRAVENSMSQESYLKS